ncbi:MAG: helix-turn-helix domain-containing protein, partial [Oscillospiraceae bacterium]|nr:helix-turn-helix domain-containing protein [Oscillospiraceae bacterium]MDY2678350.1 helix-turn-helix domain-containing protein [Oscillospiraceae bacterium]
MGKELISIGKMAEMSRLTVATLRLYDELGLLVPKHKDPETGYRYYDIAQNARLDMIAYMKELGMSLTEIGEVLKKEDIVLIETILNQKNEQLHSQMRLLRAQHDAVERAIASIERYRKSPVQGSIVLEYIDRRYIWGMPCKTNFYKEGLRAFEQELVDLRKALMERGFLQAHSYSVGTSIEKDDFINENFVPKDTFVFVGYRDNLDLADAAVVDSGMYACVYLDSFDDEIDFAKKLLEHCKEQNWTVCGDYFCEIMTEFNVFDDSRRSMFLRLQVPVNFAR